MQTIIICETFGWTFTEYMDQPIEFIALIREKMKIDAQRSEQEIKKMNQK